jgi:D-sedoheptulose 7-phosphate isomerase
MDRHIQHLLQRCPALTVCTADVLQAFEIIRACFRRGGKMLLCGNGGSAADAEHWAGELLKGFAHRRPLNQKDKQRLPAGLALKLQGGLPAIPLTGFVSLGTAFANDVDPQLVFAQLVWGIGRPGDILVGMSTSGNARNVCAAMEAARARGLVRVGLSGKTGGRLFSKCDLCIRVPANVTYLVQELHLPIYHCLSLMLEDDFFGNPSKSESPKSKISI